MQDAPGYVVQHIENHANFEHMLLKCREHHKSCVTIAAAATALYVFGLEAPGSSAGAGARTGRRPGAAGRPGEGGHASRHHSHDAAVPHASSQLVAGC
jgi:hypothetical protein